jgi:L-alanine-DL-glutamate epimerase-like enolase superfamily enzyme
LPHVFASLHGQLAAANDEVAAAEVIPAASGTDPIDELLARAPTIADGHLVVDDGPGVGFEIDWLAVERWSNSHRRVAVDAFSVNHTNRGETR